MMSSPSDRAKAIHEEARCLPASRREAFLDDACGRDAPLRAQVECLLQNEEATLPVADDAPRRVAAGGSGSPVGVGFEFSVLESAGSVIGRYRLLEKIGEGGFGSVWAAEQREPVKRRVALKIIKLGMDTKQVVARFEAERQALALMDHPNIAKVLDAGASDAGRPYFVMELVKGIPITNYCEQENLGVDARLNLFIKVCQAIQHAHQKGIIHRDIKPSNILVTLHDGVPVPKVIDFGIAKATQQELTELTIYTQYQQFIGRPAYMSPEQAEMSGLDIDTRSDIYSLGVLLYELLTGGTPFDARELVSSGVDGMRRIIREREPVKPSTRLSQGLSRSAGAAPSAPSRCRLSSDLDWIVLKCLEKDRTRRYETANGLAADLQRNLEDEPVMARPPSTAYRLQKAWRRHRLAYAAGGAVLVALVLGTGVSLWQAYRANVARDKAVAAEAHARAALHFIQDDILSQAHPELEPNRDLTVRSLFDRVARSLDASRQPPPMVEAAIRQTIGSIYTELGEYDKAVHNYRIALTHQRRELGAHHADTLRSLHGLAMNQWWSGDIEGAESLAEEGFAASSEALGERDPLTLQFMQARALTMAFRGSLPWKDLKPFFLRTLDLHTEIFGLDDQRTLRLIYGFGLSSTIRDGDLEAITPLVTEAVEHASSTLGEDHPLTGALMAVMAQLHWTLKEFAEAELVARRCMETRRARLGESHPLTVNAMLGLARMKAEQRDFEGALLLTDRVDELTRQKPIDTFPLWASQLSGIGSAFLRHGEIDLAEAFAVKGQEAMRRRPDAFPAGQGQILMGLGVVRLKQERYDEAEQLLRESLQLCERYLPQGISRWLAANSLGLCLARQGNYAEAEPLLLESCKEMIRRYDTMWPIHDPKERVVDGFNRLISCYESQGRLDEAAAWRDRLAAFRQSKGLSATPSHEP